MSDDAKPAAKSVKVQDARGRTITLRTMNALERLDFFEMAGANATNGPWLGMAVMAASVRQIDDVPCPFPRERVILRSTIDRLGDEGLDAVRSHLEAESQAAGDGAQGDEEMKATAKN